MSKAEEFVKASMARFNALFEYDAEGRASVAKHKKEERRIWASLSPTEKREAEKGYFATIEGEWRKHAK